MGVYHITYSPGLRQVCLFFNEKCNFSCKGCVRKSTPQDSHLNEDGKNSKTNKVLITKEVISYLASVSFDKVIFLGSEPTVDSDFLSLAEGIKKRFSSYNTLITNGYRHIQERILDEVCVSIKAVSSDIFRTFTGRNNPEQVMNNFKKYAEFSWIKLRAESIFIPGYIDCREVEKISSFIAEIDERIPYRIDAYIPSRRYLPVKKNCFRRPTEKEMFSAKLSAEKHLRNVSILYKGIPLKNKVERIY
ncbi:MAG: radical SAM protein [Candidatus Omnitrophota bacterium]